MFCADLAQFNLKISELYMIENTNIRYFTIIKHTGSVHSDTIMQVNIWYTATYDKGKYCLCYDAPGIPKSQIFFYIPGS